MKKSDRDIRERETPSKAARTVGSHEKACVTVEVRQTWFTCPVTGWVTLVSNVSPLIFSVFINKIGIITMITAML